MRLLPKMAPGCGLALVLAACSSGGGAAAGGGEPPSPVEERRIASLPENPCELLTASQVAAATGLPVRQARRLPDIEEIIRAEREGRPARANTICSYDTPSDIVAITIVVPPVSDRNSGAYTSARDAYFQQYPGSGRTVSGVGDDAWLAAGNTLHVFAGKNAHFIVATRMAQPKSPEVVAAVARAVIERLYR
jgi:hypothetical protein